MTKIVRSVLLVAAMCGLVAAGGLTVAPAQVKDKKDSKDSKDAPKDTKAEKVGTVEIHEAKDGYRFNIKDADGKTLAMSTKGYDKKEDCLKVLDAVKNTLNNAKVTEVKKDK